MRTETIGTWDGDYRKVVKAILCKTQEIHIRVQGKKLIIKDCRIGYYSCIQMGDSIEIPVYENLVEEEDEIAILDEPLTVKSKEITEEQIKLLKEWGLWKQ